jgi:hypothetical protein
MQSVIRAPAARGEEGLHHLPGVRREGAAHRLHRAAAEERSRRPQDCRFLFNAKSERLTSFLAMDETATREPDTQALEQILIGHMMAIAGEANQIFRPVTMFDHGIDGEVEFKDNDGKASGKRITIQLKSGNCR